MFSKIFPIVAFASVLIMASSQLTLMPPPAAVGPIEIISGKAPAEGIKVFVIVNPVDEPQQFWVQKMGRADSKKNWSTAVHFGNPGPHHGQQFRVMAVADSKRDLEKELHEGDVLDDWPRTQWKSEIVTVARK